MYIITSCIEAKLMQLQAMQERIQGSSSSTVVTKQRIEEVQQLAAQCTAELATIQSELGGIHAKISVMTE